MRGDPRPWGRALAEEEEFPLEDWLDEEEERGDDSEALHAGKRALGAADRRRGGGRSRSSFSFSRS